MSNMTSTSSILIMKNVEDDKCEHNFHLKSCHQSYIDDHDDCSLVLDDQPNTMKDDPLKSEKSASLLDLIPVVPVASNCDNMSPCFTGHSEENTQMNECNIESHTDKMSPLSMCPDEARVPSRVSDDSTFDAYYRHSSASLDGDDEYDDVLHDPIAVTSKLKEMEEEQEQLNNSLIALTSHFAQVQLRLKQIVSASSDEKERLLKDLEEFAFSGIPDLASVNLMVNQTQDEMNEDKHCEAHEKSRCSSSHSSPRASDSRMKLSSEGDLSCKLQIQREKQKKLMGKLKDQLEELEKYAYETGDSKCIPSSMLIERQNVIIEQLKGTLALNLDRMDKLSPDELRQQVDQALKNVSVC